MRPPRIAIGTCRELPEPDVDEELLNAALRSRGAEPVLVPWDGDERVDWSTFDLCVIRSTWNYLEDPVRFRTWLDEIHGTCPLWNPIELLAENLDKRYLRTLEAQGIAIVPTFWVSGRVRDGATTEENWESELETRGWHDYVIKPTISAGSFGTRRFREEPMFRENIGGGLAPRGEARNYLSAGLRERDWMVQMYCPTVETSGECAIVVIDDEISHVVRKNPRFTGDDESVSDARPPSDAEHAFATRVLEVVPGSLLYGRVDVIEDPQEGGRLLLAELELLEPSLFLKQHPPALERFADAIVERARSS